MKHFKLNTFFVFIFFSFLLVGYSNCSKKTSHGQNSVTSASGSVNIESGTSQAVRSVGPVNPATAFTGDNLTGNRAIVLEVQVLGEFDEASYQWFKNGVNIINAQDSQFRIELSSAQPADSARYYVELNVDGERFRSATAFFTVLSEIRNSNLPNIVIQPHNTDEPNLGLSLVALNQGERLSLAVESTSGSPQTFQWFHDDMMVVNSNNSNLIIENVQMNHSGNYRVQISNSFGEVVSASIPVRVTAVCSFTANDQAIGAFESISNGVAIGWGVNTDDTCTAADIEFWIDTNKNGAIDFTSGTDTRIGTVKANELRPDVGIAYPKVGDNHGFRFTVPRTRFGQVIYAFIVVNKVRFALRKSSTTSLIFNGYGGKVCPIGSKSNLSNNLVLTCTRSVTATAKWTSVDLIGKVETCFFNLVENFTGGCGNIRSTQAVQPNIEAILYAGCKAEANRLIEKHYNCSNKVNFINVVWDALPAGSTKDTSFLNKLGKVSIKQQLTPINK